MTDAEEDDEHFADLDLIDSIMERQTMTTAAKGAHTKTPWTVEIESEKDADGTEYGVQICIPEINRLLWDPDWADQDDWERSKADAELIVNAVNCHADLLEALEAYHERSWKQWDNAAGCAGDDTTKEEWIKLDKLAQKAEQAIRKARAGGGGG